MIVQAIALLDDLDKEINIYAMRVKVRGCFVVVFLGWTNSFFFKKKEWYGWHFPELAKIITDNLAYAKVLRTMGKEQSPCRPSTCR
jgi:nucleolar protein 58